MIGSKLIIIISLVFFINLKITRQVEKSKQQRYCLVVTIPFFLLSSKIPKEQWTSLLAKKRPNRSMFFKMFFKMFIADFIFNGIFCMIGSCGDMPENNDY
ncbi:hypothetical protein ILUMI_11565 [Ignelater luminosus]|uniref:Uncharacterized protein n=1 Tax=Ignelater luminosus TaxID=2038154 RepID=A0A8K0GCL0_IGNLU|nr:hypothetical protein ILUMI_11565 [Ignelater luminosus]